jgi:hypothetical protein
MGKQDSDGLGTWLSVLAPGERLGLYPTRSLHADGEALGTTDPPPLGQIMGSHGRSSSMGGELLEEALEEPQEYGDG